MTAKLKKERNSKHIWESAFIRSGITGNTGLVGLLMATHDNGDGSGFFLSANRVSDYTGLHERTVREHISKLVDAGWVRVTRRGGNHGGKARANSYELVIPYPSFDAEDDPQLGDPRPQPGDPRGQDEGTGRVLDQYLLDQNSRDQYPEAPVVDTRPEWKQRQQVQRELEFEGLGPDGTPIDDDERRPRGRLAYGSGGRY